MAATTYQPSSDRLRLMDARYGGFVGEADREKEMFGSVMSAFEVVFPSLTPLRHEVSEIIIATRIILAVRSICLRIRNSSRTNFGM
ncbi:MAG: hypothetical protein JOZ21_13000 [Verrucomicrobia bacterium]|nr:hypothetical protein [Verrucomicrobiota bacterium]